MQYIELLGRLFRVNLRSPLQPAQIRFGGLWIDHFLTNEDVSLHPEAHTVNAWMAEPFRVLTPTGASVRLKPTAVVKGRFLT